MNYIIYKITDNTNGQCYIGSTKLKINDRVSSHRSKYKRFLLGKSSSYITSFEILKNNNFTITTIENNISKINKSVKECYHIRNTNNCVNKNIPNRTASEFYRDNRPYFINLFKEYYNTHKEALAPIRKRYYEANRDIILARSKLYYQKNRDAIMARTHLKT
jgi:predicted GIY-YIG superfamily endonuclease